MRRSIRWPFALVVVLSCAAQAAQTRLPARASPSERRKMISYLAALYSPNDVRGSFKLADGTKVDCVLVGKQPGLRKQRGAHPLSPPRPPAMPGPRGGGRAPSAALADIFLHGEKDQEGHARKCAAGTIPIIKPTLEVLLHYRTLADFLRKTPKPAAHRPPASPHKPASAPPGRAHVPASGLLTGHQYAKGDLSVTNYGAHARLNLWKPKLDKPSGMSLSQIWVTAGLYTWTDDQGVVQATAWQTLEVGVQVQPRLWTDDLPRLFIYSTSDHYDQTGCYNLCDRFVQTSSTLPIGEALLPSVAGDAQAELDVAFYKSPGRNNPWWLFINGQAIGYYRAALFSDAYLNKQADTLSFGGEIFTDEGLSTPTQMGSGCLPADGWSHAAYQRQIFYWPTSSKAPGVDVLFPGDPGSPPLELWATAGSGYQVAAGPPLRASLFFGGPGCH